MMAMVWYCGRCRKVIRSRPPEIARGCKCAVPQIGSPTKVVW